MRFLRPVVLMSAFVATFPDDSAFELARIVPLANGCDFLR